MRYATQKWAHRELPHLDELSALHFSFGYEVRVVSAGWNFGGSRMALLYAAKRSDKIDGVHLRWTTEKKLLLEYLDARGTEVYTSRTVRARAVSNPSAPSLPPANEETTFKTDQRHEPRRRKTPAS